MARSSRFSRTVLFHHCYLHDYSCFLQIYLPVQYLIILKTLNNAELILIYILTILALLFDMVSNYRVLLQGKCVQYIFSQDPYYFRVQIFLFFPFMIFSLVCELLNLATTLDYIGVVTNFRTTIWLNTVTFVILYLIDVLFPLSLTILHCILHCIRKRQTKVDKFNDEIKDKEVQTLFIEFCASGFSLENILCYLDIEEYKKTQKDPLSIYFKYLNGRNSYLEANFTRSSRSNIYEALTKGDITMKLFDPIMPELYENLFDTYTRFLSTTAYKNLVQDRKKNMKILEQI
jgi:hypothetical protein